MARPQDTSPQWKNRIVRYGTMAADQFLAHPLNPNIHPPKQQAATKGSLDTLGWVLPVVIGRSGYLIDGHDRIYHALAMGDQTPVPFIELDLEPHEETLALTILDNITRMAVQDRDHLQELMSQIDTDNAALQSMLNTLAMDVGIVDFPTDAAPLPDAPVIRPSLADTFIVPPFSVLDARQGYWQERKRQWIAIGIESELGRGMVRPHGKDTRPVAETGIGDYRGGDAWRSGSTGVRPQSETASLKGGLTWPTSIHPYDSTGEKRNALGAMRTFGEQDIKQDAFLSSEKSGTSIFDPVLCELAYRWFSAPDARVLDPFAGGSVRGLVASLLGRSYTGIDLRAEQVAANEQQAARLTPDNRPQWIAGDSRSLNTLVSDRYDFVFSCPPYFDLEIYSDDAADLSNANDYGAFMDSYQAIVKACCERLDDNRFACFVVGDLRDKKGAYRNFVSDTIDAFLGAGLVLYNEAILVTSVGSLPIRVGKQFTSGRKLGKTHQNVLVFLKGDSKKATAYCGPVEAHFPEDTMSADIPFVHEINF